MPCRDASEIVSRTCSTSFNRPEGQPYNSTMQWTPVTTCVNCPPPFPVLGNLCCETLLDRHQPVQPTHGTPRTGLGPRYVGVLLSCGAGRGSPLGAIGVRRSRPDAPSGRATASGHGWPRALGRYSPRHAENQIAVCDRPGILPPADGQGQYGWQKNPPPVSEGFGGSAGRIRVAVVACFAGT